MVSSFSNDKDLLWVHFSPEETDTAIYSSVSVYLPNILSIVWDWHDASNPTMSLTRLVFVNGSHYDLVLEKHRTFLRQTLVGDTWTPQ